MQVEPHNRDWARGEGEYIYAAYVQSGFFDLLLQQLQQSKRPPRFEFEVRGFVQGVPVLCKPDCQFVTPASVEVVHDWKVNGFCSKSATSPCKGYALCMDGYIAAKQSKSHGTEHGQYLAYQHKDITINTTYLEASNPSWADQLSLYGWSLGEKIGDEDVVLSIHQTVAKAVPQCRPLLRVASYRARVAAEYQRKLVERLKRCWESITSGHIFLDMRREDSDARCAILDDTAVGLLSDGSSLDQYFNESTRDRYRG